MNRICEKCGVEFELTHQSQKMCRACRYKYPSDAKDFPADYIKIQRALIDKKHSDEIYARRKIRSVRERIEGVDPEMWREFKFDATRLDEILWKH